jgi:hypothetical protein
MTDTDPFRYDDAAYVLGALDPDERAAFEEHLRTCAECRARVGEVDDMPALLADIGEAEMVVDPVPATLLPSLLRAAARQHRRQRLTVGALTALAAACVIALVVALWPTSGSHAPPRQDFVPVAQSSPVLASATLTAKTWGTAIDVHCHYVSASVDHAFSYGLVVYDRHGTRHQVGDWRLPPDRDIDYQAGTSLLPQQISKIEITLPDGTPLLRLNT